MGVPRLAGWLFSTFPNAVKHFQSGEFIFHIDNLYIDAASLLHACNQQVHNYGQKKRHLDPYKNLTPLAKQNLAFKLFFESIVQLAEIVVPSKTLYIAIDGFAPIAKQAEQRKRRFVAASTRGGTADGTVFDSNSMTPGTVFMLELNKYMHYMIRNKINSTPSWRNLNVIFSSFRVPGEAEHKLMDYIRALPRYVSENESHCVFGPDGDLIMLTLSAHLPKMYLFREDQYSIGFYHLIDMGMVRENLPSSLGQASLVMDGTRTLNEVTDDFILAGFFVGNDFLPKIQMFMFLEDGLELMLATVTRLAGSGTFLTEHEKISHAGFTRFVEELARREIVYIADQARIPPADPRFKNETLLKHMSGSKLDMGGYREDYYKKANIDIDDGFAVKNIALASLQSMAWVFEYYIHGLSNWRQFYHYHYAPLMGDLVEAMQEITPDEIDFAYLIEKNSPSAPFVQLISVLPPNSAHLLPAPFRHLLQSPTSPLVKAGFYPKEFKIDYEGKTKEHMGVALLPFVDIDKVIEAYTPIAAELKNTYVRNTRGRPESFRYDPKYLAEYRSDYGNISKVKVRKTIL